jgi:hypothetical protein
MTTVTTVVDDRRDRHVDDSDDGRSRRTSVAACCRIGSVVSVATLKTAGFRYLSYFRRVAVENSVADGEYVLSQI